MTKQEFEERIGKTISESDYHVVETVYAFHPAIDNVRGKDQIAGLYKDFGLSIIRDMLPTAERAKEIEEKIAKAQSELEYYKQRLAELKA